MLLIMNALVAAKMVVAAKWKSQHLRPSEEQLLKFRFIFLMNNLSAIANYYEGHESVVEKFKKCWTPFLLYWNQIKPKENIENDILGML